jgi:hypothetical protein
MPTEFILDSATAIANDWKGLALVWHVALAVLLVALIAGWRPSVRTLTCLITLPFVTVSALAWWAGNPFNGTVFGLLVLVLLGLAIRVSPQPLRTASKTTLVVGSCLVAFGWFYPHFVRVPHWTSYGYAAPFGLLPCPTLSAVIGIALMIEGLPSTAWSGVVAGAALIYGAIGVLILGVALDYALLVGAAVLLTARIQFARVRARPTTTSHENLTNRWSSASRIRS